MAWTASAGNAEGPLYAVPSEPPPTKESVDFTNDLNHRVRHLPPSLDPPVAESPAEVEARIRVLERGVVIEQGSKKPGERPRKAAAAGNGKSGTRSDGAPTVTVQEASTTADDPAPLSIAFVGAGALAVLGLFLSARGSLQRVRSG